MLIEQKREGSLRRRAAAGRLADAFPRTASIRVQLQFIPASGPEPAAQTHALYPSAPAYFDFSCPYGDCDGSFDLNGVALPLLGSSGQHAEGTLHCPGTRTAGGTGRRACRLRADFWVNVQYEKISRMAG
jgi:hypothetical protein